MTITRRDLIKTGAIAGGLAWVSPTIESFTAKASAASVQHACCACFSGGAFIAAAADDFTDLGCRVLCTQAATPGQVGTFLRFTGPSSFIAKGVTEINPGCTFGSTFLDGLAGAGPTLCPPANELPAGLACDTGVWSA